MLIKEYNNNNKVTLLKSGRIYFDRIIELIKNAQKKIHIQTYIFLEDETGKKVANELIAAAKRKIEIFLLVDGYASKSISTYLINKFISSGIHFRFFRPVLKSNFRYFTRRLHHKIVVVDNNIGIVGGLNIADRYNDVKNIKAWLDFAVIIEGETVEELNRLCENMWLNDSFDTNHHIKNNHPLTYHFKKEEKTDIRIRLNDWLEHKSQISATYIEMFRKAKKEITILCSYFLPGRVMRRQMIRAVKRGVDVKVVVAGPSDVWIAKNAERWLYDWLLRNKIQIFEYQNNILHGKIAAYDDTAATIGSYNINNLSTYSSIELNVDIKNTIFAKQVKETINEIIEKDCISITEKEHKKSKNIFKQFARWLSYQFIYGVYTILTIAFKRKY
jgi:cardiolipin synthase